MKLLLVLLLTPVLCLAQRGRNFVDSLEQIVEIKQNLVKITDNYYLIQPQTVLPASNITLYTGAKYTLIVDSQWAKLGPGIESVVASVTTKRINCVVTTHYHFDHSNGIKYFSKNDASIVAPKKQYDRLASDQQIGPAIGFGGSIFQRAAPSYALPTITFRDTLTLRDERETISVIHFEGAHTDGDAIVHFKEADIYCTGDIFVTYGIPFIDEANGGDIYMLLDFMDRLISVSGSKTRIVPGHGPVCGVNDLIAYRKMLSGYKDQVVALVKMGRSLKEIEAEVKLEDSIDGFKKEFMPHIYRMAVKHERTRK